MKNKVRKLLNKQMEARNVLGTEVLEEARVLLAELGCEHLLTVGETIIKEIPVEVIKEIKVEVPVEIIKEVKVEVPVEVIKEIEVVKAVSSSEDKKTIKELNKEIKKINKALEHNKGVNTTLREKIKELKKTKPAVKEVPVADTKALAEAAKEHSKIVMDLKNKIAAKDSIIEALNQKIQELEAGKTNKKSNARVHIEEPARDVSVEGLQIIKDLDTHVIGRYKGVAFDAMKRVEGTNVYDPTKWGMKAEINQVLVDAGYISLNRDIKDSNRVECATGSCHEISDKKYMGYVVVNGVAHSYIFNTAYPNGYPSCVELNTYLTDPTKAVRKTTTTKSVVDAINDLIAKHNAKANEVVKNAGSTIEDLGISFVDTTTEPQNTTVVNAEVEEPVATNNNNTQEETVIEDTAINSESTEETKEQEQAPQNDMVFVSFDEEVVFEGGEDIITTPPSYMGKDNSVDW